MKKELNFKIGVTLLQKPRFGKYEYYIFYFHQAIDVLNVLRTSKLASLS